MRFMGWNFLVAAILAAPISAQEIDPAEEPEASDTSQVPTSAPIIVSGEQDNAKRVIVGSRIPRRQIFNAPGIATSTGTRGLTPQSGMDPAANIRRVKRTKCTSDDPNIGKKAACFLIEAQSALRDEELAKARDLLAYVTLSDEFTRYEQLAAAKWQYRLAQDQGNDESRETALEQMIATGAMPPLRELQARRTLISLALGDGRRTLARERLIQLDALGAANAQHLANLAILTREHQAGDGRAIMHRAIAKREAQKGAVPIGWRNFVQAETP